MRRAEKEMKFNERKKSVPVNSKNKITLPKITNRILNEQSGIDLHLIEE